jgi:abhydrolase domain-containing protein 6
MPNPLFMAVIDAVRFVSGFSAKSADVHQHNWSYIERVGKNELGTDVVVFLHGFSSMKETWVRVARGVDNRFKVIIPDLPGHGRTTPIDVLTDYSIPAQAKRLHEFFEKEVPSDKKIHLVGCSMGGMLAGVYAGLYPDRVKSLTMICPAGISMPKKSDLLVMLEESGRNLLLAHTAEDIQEMNVALSSKPIRLPNAVASIIASERKKQLPVLEKIVGDAMQNPTALEELLPNIRAKTLVLWGRRDRVLDVSSVEVLEQKLSPEARGQYLLFDDCGHTVQHEKHAECTAVINKLLAEESPANEFSTASSSEKRSSSGKLKLFVHSARKTSYVVK